MFNAVIIFIVDSFAPKGNHDTVDILLNKNRKNKKKKRQKKSSKKLPPEIIANKPSLKKYWAQRYKLFSKYDDGIKLDLGICEIMLVFVCTGRVISVILIIC